MFKPDSSRFDGFVNPFWLQFDEGPSWVYTLSILHLATVTGLSFVGNSLLIYGTVRGKIKIGRAGPYILVVALSDIISPVSTYWMGILSNYHKLWALDKTACSIYGFTQGYCSLLSIALFAAISLEWYFTICKPHISQKITLRHQICIIVGLCVYVMILTVPPLFGWSAYNLDGFLTSCCFEIIATDIGTRSFFVYLLVLSFLVPVAIIIACYCAIFRAIKRRQSESKAQNSANDNDMRGMVIIFVAFLAFTITWTPFAIVALLAQFGRTDLVGPFAVWVPGLVAKTATCYNPFLFLFVDRGYNRSLALYAQRIPVEDEKEEETLIRVPETPNTGHNIRSLRNEMSLARARFFEQ